MLLSPLLSLLPFLSLLSLISPTAALDNTSIRSRSIYQVLTDRFARSDNSTTASCSLRTYCGGTWRGLISRLDYIQGMGFDTVWISPVVENVPGTTYYGEAYHGYWTQNPNNLNTHFGTAADLLALSTALHKRGMYLMVDVVVNHVAWNGAFSSFKPSSTYGPFTSTNYFHNACFIDYSSQSSIEYCSLGDSNLPLPDINTENPYVVEFWKTWIKKMVTTYNIDAIRVDTVKHVRIGFWPEWAAEAGVYALGEVFDGSPSYVAAYQNQGGLSPLNYPIWYPLLRAFQSTSGSLNDLVWNVGQIQAAFNDVSVLGGFVNNHDNARFESYVTDPALRRNVHAFPFVTDGVPIVYYGSEAGYNGGSDPNNREAFWPTGYKTNLVLYSFFANLNGARKAAGTQSGFYTSKMSMTVLSINDLLIIKRPLISILSNRGSSSSSSNYTLTTSQTGWKGGMSIREVISSKIYTTDASGNLVVSVKNGNPVVLIDASLKA